MRDSAQALLAHHRRRARLLQDRGRPARAGRHRVLAVRPDRPARSTRSGRRRPPRGCCSKPVIAAGSNDALVGDPTRVRQILFNLLVQRAEVHRARAASRCAPRTAPLGDGATRVTLGGARHRHRLERRAARAAVPAVRAGRFLDHAALRRHRPRPFDRAAAAELMDGDRRHREHAGQGLDLHGDADAQGRAGGFAARAPCCGPTRRPSRTALRAPKRAAPRAGGRRSSGQPRGAGAPARSARARRRQRQRRRRGAWRPGRPASTPRCWPTSTCRAWTATSWRARSASAEAEGKRQAAARRWSRSPPTP